MILGGEKGINFSKNFIAILTLLIIMLTTVSAAVAYTVGVKTVVEQMSLDINEVKQGIKEIQPRINQNERDIAVMRAYYENIDLNIKDIKRTLESK